MKKGSDESEKILEEVWVKESEENSGSEETGGVAGLKKTEMEMVSITEQKEPVLDECSNEFGIEFTQDAVGILGMRVVKLKMGFPQTEQPLNLPAQVGEGKDLCGREIGGDKGGEVDGVGTQSQGLGRGGDLFGVFILADFLFIAGLLLGGCTLCDQIAGNSRFCTQPHPPHAGLLGRQGGERVEQIHRLTRMGIEAGARFVADNPVHTTRLQLFEMAEVKVAKVSEVQGLGRDGL